MDDDVESRVNKIRQLLAQEIEDGENLAAEARKMIAYLLLEKKGYRPDDVQRGVAFEVELGGGAAMSSVDFIVSVDGMKAMIVKCAAGSLDSRQRQAVAAARVIASPPVPIAVVADPENAEVIDVATGKVIGEGFGAIPVKGQLVRILAETETKPLALDRIEKEKRILLAFDAIKCCVPQGTDGGVQLKSGEVKEMS
ncbi:MAG TPA: type I restriction enzyme HsdR N-terminal domain-containing protein [Nitrospirota bacterium]|nr:type I restriction enzyme HsdR N-terminal domain-containing protein [Nitrospirota bacterium]